MNRVSRFCLCITAEDVSNKVAPMHTRPFSSSSLIAIVWMEAFLVALLPDLTRAASCVPPPSGLVSWWPGDGNALDYAGNNNSTAVGGISFPQGEVEQAFGFDGTSGLIQVPSAADLDPI
jgi:hypothetical protein